RRAVLGTGLAIDGEIGGDRQIGRHADLLAAGDAHAVDAADHGFFAVQDAVHHGVEQIHVLAVFVRAARIVGRVFGGVAAGAKRLVADRGEHDRHDAAIGGRFLKTGDHALYHFGGIGIVLRRVVQPDPGGIESLGFPAAGVDDRALLINDARRFAAEMTVVEKLMVFQLVVAA